MSGKNPSTPDARKCAIRVCCWFNHNARAQKSYKLGNSFQGHSKPMWFPEALGAMCLVRATHSSGLVRAEHPLKRPGLNVVLGHPQCTLMPSLACRRRYQLTLRARRGPKSVTLRLSSCKGVEVNPGTPDPVPLKDPEVSTNVELARWGRSMS
jgi:hypothetical protein